MSSKLLPVSLPYTTVFGRRDEREAGLDGIVFVW